MAKPQHSATLNFVLLAKKKSVQGLGVKAAFGAKRQTSSKCKAFAIQRCNGGCTQVVPLSPLKKKAKNRITKKHDN